MISPVKREGRVIGAIGVSGGSGEQDQAVAEPKAAFCATSLVSQSSELLQQLKVAGSLHFEHGLNADKREMDNICQLRCSGIL